MDQRPARVTLELEIETASDPIIGQLRRPDGTTRHFDGWLGLATALERALADDRAPAKHPELDDPG